MTSSDGITWSSQTSTEDNDWQGVTWSPELYTFAAIASNGTNRLQITEAGTCC